MRFMLALAAASCLLPSTTALAQTQKPPKTITLSGCVERDADTPNQFTITDAKEHTKYRVTGKEFGEYLGRRVQLDGGVVVKGVRISGGLQPNPNIAAQAGAIDPARAAVQAATTPSPTPPADEGLPEFRVKTIKPVTGTCSE